MNAYSYWTDQIRPPAVAGLVLWNRFCQPFLLSRFLLWTRSPVFSKFWYAGRNRCEAVRNFLGKNLFCPNWSHKLIKPKIKFIELWKNLVILTEFVVMKIYIFGVFVPTSYLRNISFLRYGPKCSQPLQLQVM